jgi:hypothetical protein
METIYPSKRGGNHQWKAGETKLICGNPKNFFKGKNCFHIFYYFEEWTLFLNHTN